MKLDFGLLRRAGDLVGHFTRGYKRTQRRKERVEAVVKKKAFGIESKKRRPYSWDDDDYIFETEEDMPGYQLHLPNDGQWHTCRITPAEGFEAQFSSGRTVSEPVVAWLTQVKATAPQATSGTPAVTRVVPGILRDGEIVNAAEQDGYERVEQV